MRRVTDEKGFRWYEGVGKYISISSILATIPNKKRESLQRFKGFQEADKISQEAMSFGTVGHEYIERILKGETPDIGNQQHRELINAFKEWKDKVELEPLHLEKRLLSAELGIAGTVDYIGKYKGEIVIADWKFSNSYNISYGYQLAAYRLMVQEELGLECGLLGVQLDKNDKKVREFKYEHFDSVELAFLCTFQLFKYLNYNYLKKTGWSYLDKKVVIPNG